MQERRVTVLGETHPLPEPFFVLATQNPIELEGTYPLPEAQLDRFLFKLDVRGVGVETFLTRILKRRRGAAVSAACCLWGLAVVSATVDGVSLPEPVVSWNARIVVETNWSPECVGDVERDVCFGAPCARRSRTSRSRPGVRRRPRGLADVDSLML